MVVAPLSTRDWKLLEPKFCRHRSHVPPPGHGRASGSTSHAASLYLFSGETHAIPAAGRCNGEGH